MLHHECRHMAVHLRNTDKEPTITMDSPETAELRLMTSYPSEDKTPVGDVSRNSTQHVHRDDGQPGDVGRGMESTRIEYNAYATPQQSAGLANTNRKGHFRCDSSFYDAVRLYLGGNGRPDMLVCPKLLL